LVHSFPLNSSLGFRNVTAKNLGGKAGEKGHENRAVPQRKKSGKGSYRFVYKGTKLRKGERGGASKIITRRKNYRTRELLTAVRKTKQVELQDGKLRTEQGCQTLILGDVLQSAVRDEGDATGETKGKKYRGETSFDHNRTSKRAKGQH